MVFLSTDFAVYEFHLFIYSYLFMYLFVYHFPVNPQSHGSYIRVTQGIGGEGKKKARTLTDDVQFLFILLFLP